MMLKAKEERNILHAMKRRNAKWVLKLAFELP